MGDCIVFAKTENHHHGVTIGKIYGSLFLLVTALLLICGCGQSEPTFAVCIGGGKNEDKAAQTKIL